MGFWIGENESSKYWLNILNELKNRGVQDILIMSVDNLKGFSEAISSVFSKTEIQKCISTPDKKQHKTHRMSGSSHQT